MVTRSTGARSASPLISMTSRIRPPIARSAKRIVVRPAPAPTSRTFDRVTRIGVRISNVPLGRRTVPPEAGCASIAALMNGAASSGGPGGVACDSGQALAASSSSSSSLSQNRSATAIRTATLCVETALGSGVLPVLVAPPEAHAESNAAIDSQAASAATPRFRCDRLECLVGRCCSPLIAYSPSLVSASVSGPGEGRVKVARTPSGRPFGGLAGGCTTGVARACGGSVDILTDCSPM